MEHDGDDDSMEFDDGDAPNASLLFEDPNRMVAFLHGLDAELSAAGILDATPQISVNSAVSAVTESDTHGRMLARVCTWCGRLVSAQTELHDETQIHYFCSSACAAAYAARPMSDEDMVVSLATRVEHAPPPPPQLGTVNVGGRGMKRRLAPGEDTEELGDGDGEVWSRRPTKVPSRYTGGGIMGGLANYMAMIRDTAVALATDDSALSEDDAVSLVLSGKSRSLLDRILEPMPVDGADAIADLANAPPTGAAFERSHIGSDPAWSPMASTNALIRFIGERLDDLGIVVDVVTNKTAHVDEDVTMFDADGGRVVIHTDDDDAAIADTDDTEDAEMPQLTQKKQPFAKFIEWITKAARSVFEIATRWLSRTADLTSWIVRAYIKPLALSAISTVRGWVRTAWSRLCDVGDVLAKVVVSAAVGVCTGVRAVADAAQSHEFGDLVVTATTLISGLAYAPACVPVLASGAMSSLVMKLGSMLARENVTPKEMAAAVEHAKAEDPAPAALAAPASPPSDGTAPKSIMRKLVTMLGGLIRGLGQKIAAYYSALRNSAVVQGGVSIGRNILDHLGITLLYRTCRNKVEDLIDWIAATFEARGVDSVGAFVGILGSFVRTAVVMGANLLARPIDTLAQMALSATSTAGGVDIAVGVALTCESAHVNGDGSSSSSSSSPTTTALPEIAHPELREDIARARSAAAHVGGKVTEALSLLRESIKAEATEQRTQVLKPFDLTRAMDYCSDRIAVSGQALAMELVRWPCFRPADVRAMAAAFVRCQRAATVWNVSFFTDASGQALASAATRGACMVPDAFDTVCEALRELEDDGVQQSLAAVKDAMTKDDADRVARSQADAYVRRRTSRMSTAGSSGGATAADASPHVGMPLGRKVKPEPRSSSRSHDQSPARAQAQAPPPLVPVREPAPVEPARVPDDPAPVPPRMPAAPPAPAVPLVQRLPEPAPAPAPVPAQRPPNRQPAARDRDLVDAIVSFNSLPGMAKIMVLTSVADLAYCVGTLLRYVIGDGLHVWGAGIYNRLALLAGGDVRYNATDVAELPGILDARRHKLETTQETAQKAALPHEVGFRAVFSRNPAPSPEAIAEANKAWTTAYSTADEYRTACTGLSAMAVYTLQREKMTPDPALTKQQPRVMHSAVSDRVYITPRHGMAAWALPTGADAAVAVGGNVHTYQHDLVDSDLSALRRTAPAMLHGYGAIPVSAADMLASYLRVDVGAAMAATKTALLGDVALARDVLRSMDPIQLLEEIQKYMRPGYSAADENPYGIPLNNPTVAAKVCTSLATCVADIGMSRSSLPVPLRFLGEAMSRYVTDMDANIQQLWMSRENATATTSDDKKDNVLPVVDTIMSSLLSMGGTVTGAAMHHNMLTPQKAVGIGAIIAAILAAYERFRVLVHEQELLANDPRVPPDERQARTLSRYGVGIRCVGTFLSSLSTSALGYLGMVLVNQGILGHTKGVSNPWLRMIKFVFGRTLWPPMLVYMFRVYGILNTYALQRIAHPLAHIVNGPVPAR